MKKCPIQQSIVQLFNKYPDYHIVIGYSGGLDSSVLLDLICHYFPPNQVTALHVNHHLMSACDQWQTFCYQQTQYYGCYWHTATLRPPTEYRNLEKWARDQRYHCFKTYLNALQMPNLLVLGHHQDDQAETFLLNVVRGSGMTGLSAIPSQIQLTNHTRLIRPFLNIPKSQLQSYAKHHQIQWIEDPSNQQTHFSRNWIRHHVLAPLQHHWSAATEKITQAATHCQQTKLVLETLLAPLVEQVMDEQSQLDCLKLQAQGPLMTRFIIHHWLTHQHHIQLNQTQLQSITDGVFQATSNWSFPVNHATLVIEQKKLQLINASSLSSTLTTKLTPTQASQWLATYGVDMDPDTITIRHRQGDDRCRYPGRAHRQRIKVLCQELQIPTWQRSQCRVITTLEGRIIGLYPWFVCPEFL